MDALTRIGSLFENARSRVLIISAYVEATTLDSLLSVSPETVERAVFASWSVSDIVSGASDWRAWDVAKRHKVPMYACPRLHAKAYVVDDTAIVGSANATRPGLGGGAYSNLELLLQVAAESKEVVELIENVRDVSVLAPPFGADISTTESHDPSRQQDPSALVWMPRSDPEFFLRAMTGKVPHSPESIEDRQSLKLASGKYGRKEIRQSLREKTIFRVVRDEFECRMLPMRQTELRKLLSGRIARDLGRMLDKDLELLVRWLGRFGENTHQSPHIDGSPSVLGPGELLSTETEFEL